MVIDMKKLLETIYVVVFLLCLIIPLCLLNTGVNVKSDLDNRVLNELPQFGVTGYEDKIESYLQDRIGLRSQIVTGYELVNYYLAGELTHPSYINGQNGYMYFKMHNNVQYGTFHEAFAEAVIKMKEYCESRGVKFYFQLDPEKIAIYQRNLPAGVSYNDEWVDILIDYLVEHGVTCVNNRELLIAPSYSEQIYNLQYDGGHWNDLGCFYATNNLWKTIHEDFPEVSEYKKDEFDITTINAEYLANSKFPVNEKVPSFKLRQAYDDISKRYLDLEMNEQYKTFHYYVNKSAGAEKYPKIMFFQGSYYNRNPLFYMGRTRECISIHDYQNVLNLDYYFNIFQPEIVVFEVAEYTFTNTYFNYNQMLSIDYNPGLLFDQNGNRVMIDDLLDHTEEFVFESNVDFEVMTRNGFDKVFIDKKLPLAKYVYLITNNQVYDMYKEDNERYSAYIPSGAIADDAILYYVDYADKAYFARLKFKEDISFFSDPERITYSEGVVYNKTNNQFDFVTELADNKFNAINIQIMNAETGQFLFNIKSISKTGSHSDSYLHMLPSGWYAIRITANSNKKDENIKSIVYLQKGRKYYYDLNISMLTAKKIVLQELEMYGLEAATFEQNELIDIDKLTQSTGTNKTEDFKYEMTTSQEENHFNAVMLQIRNCATNEVIDGIAITKKTGNNSGRYFHHAANGEYYVKLKANSNIQDECIEAQVYLSQNSIYDWSFVVDYIDQEKVIVSDFSFGTYALYEENGG